MKDLSPGATIAWQIAATEASSNQYQYIEKEHILIGICSLEKVLNREKNAELDEHAEQLVQSEYNNIKEVLHRFELNTAQLRHLVRGHLGMGNYLRSERIIHRSDLCRNVFSRSFELAGDSNYVNCLHLLAAIAEDPGRIIISVLEEVGVKSADVKDEALKQLKQVNEQNGGQGATKKTTKYLDRYGRDLISEAQEGKLGPFVGRRQELLQIIQTLARRSKNNPVLVGEAGVGKTAIVEALAMRVIDGKDPQVLAGKRIIELNMGALIGGTKYRGEFEERITHIIEEAHQHPEVILFIDEIHNLVGAGRGEGSVDAANLIKPALSRGELRCIGATTIIEYRRYVESDPALERRFEKVIVNEPSSEETLEILKGLRPKWEQHHQVQISDKALESAVNLSIRFDGDHQLPDKAIDLVDKAGARKQIPILSMPPEVVRQNGISDKKSAPIESSVTVTDQSIAEVVSEKFGLPLEVVIGYQGGLSKSKLLELEIFLQKHIIGQDVAIHRVCERLLMAHAGLTARHGPMAVFLFLGPTGVGKTKLAKTLADFLFGSELQMIRLDMSEFMEEHSIAKLIGSPPGYIGHEEEGQLTGKLRTKPYSVVLLDEIEKAHLKVFDLFLQIFDDGRLTDSKGRTTDTRNAIFIMTSNIPADKRIGFGFENTEESQTAVLNEVRLRFRNEFINRIDDQIVFRSLDKEDLRRILRPMLEEIKDNLQKHHNANLHITEQVEDFLIRVGYDPKFGARELHRAIERNLQFQLSALIFEGKLKAYDSLWVNCQGEGLKITIDPTTQ